MTTVGVDDRWSGGAQSERVLGMVRFGLGEPAANPDWPVALVPLNTLEEAAATEVWLGTAPVQAGQLGSVAYGHDGRVLFACCHSPDAPEEMPEQTTLRIYRELLNAIRVLGYPHLLRIWNYFPDINGDRAGLERYQRFSLGRYQAFEEAGSRFGGDLPAASAVGSRGAGGYCIYLLAGRVPGVQIENPRQLSAYRYPAQYGPRSPSFARATLATLGGEPHLLVSGTASIVGHASLHVGDCEAQLTETLQNIQALLDQPALPRRRALAELGADGCFKVYLRRSKDSGHIRRSLADRLSPESPVIFLEGDICRGDLLLEIEAVIRLG